MRAPNSVSRISLPQSCFHQSRLERLRFAAQGVLLSDWRVTLEVISRHCVDGDPEEAQNQKGAQSLGVVLLAPDRCRRAALQACAESRSTAGRAECRGERNKNEC